MKLRWPLMENPLMVRAFQVGFRPGPGSFRIAIWGLLLAGVLLVSIVYAVNSRSEPGWAQRTGLLLLLLLVFYTAASFFFGGLQRMLISFSSERERGTFDFIHLSTMKAQQVIWGFLAAGQLPGYLLLGLTFPVMLIAAFLGHFSIFHLLAVLLALGCYVVLISLIFLTIGFWTKKIADLRGGYLFVAVMVLFGATMLSRVGPTPWGPCEVVGIFGGYPVVQSLWERGMVGAVLGESAQAFAGKSADFFGITLPLSVLALIFLPPVAVLLVRCLAKSLRYRDRKPISDAEVLFSMVWLHVFFTGVYWGPAVPAGRKLFMLSLVSWVALAWLFARLARPSADIVRQLSLAKGRWAPLLYGREGPCYRLLVILMLELTLAGAAQMYGGGESRPLLAVMFMPLFLPVPVLLQQYLAWSTGGGRGKRYLNRGMAFLLIWLPFLLYWSLPVLKQALQQASIEIPLVPVQWFSGMSPLSLLYSVSGADLHAEYPLLWGIRSLALGFYLLATAGLVFLHTRKLCKFRAEVQGVTPALAESPVATSGEHP